MQVPASSAPLRLTIAARSGSILLRSGPGADGRGAGRRRAPRARRLVPHRRPVEQPRSHLPRRHRRDPRHVVGQGPPRRPLRRRPGHEHVGQRAHRHGRAASTSGSARARSRSTRAPATATSSRRAAASRSAAPAAIDIGGKSGSIIGARPPRAGGSARRRVTSRSASTVAADLEVRAVSSTIEIDVPPGVAPDARAAQPRADAVRTDVVRGARLHDLGAHRQRIDHGAMTADDGPGAVVFTDIVEFTRYNAERGDDAAVALLEQQSELVRVAAAAVRAGREGARRRAHALGPRRVRRGSRRASRCRRASASTQTSATIPTRSPCGSARTGARRAGGATTSSATS